MGVAIIPARPYRARDKAKAEVGVQVVSAGVVAALRKRRILLAGGSQQAIAELLVRLNQRPFRKREGSRATLFAQLDKPALKPLPAIRYQFGEWRRPASTSTITSRWSGTTIAFHTRWCISELEVHLTREALEVLCNGVRVTSHVRSYQPGKATTLTEHMPKSHQKYVGRTPSRLIEDAGQIGPYAGQLVEAILAAKRHPEQGYRSCLGILRLAKIYPAERMEAAARRCLSARAYSCQSMDSDSEEPTRPAAAAWRSADSKYCETTRTSAASMHFDSPPEAEPPVIQ